MWCIYVLTNAANGKRYVGLTRDAVARLRQHRKNARRGETGALYAAMRKHGASAFTMAIMETCANRIEADARERHWIVKLNARTSVHGYNMTAGGEGAQDASPEMRARISAWARNRTPEQIAKMRRPRSEEGRAAIATAARERALRIAPERRAALATQARKVLHDPDVQKRSGVTRRGVPKSDDHRAKIAAAHTGRKQTPEHIANMVEGKKRARDEREFQRIIAEANAFADSVLRVIGRAA